MALRYRTVQGKTKEREQRISNHEPAAGSGGTASARGGALGGSPRYVKMPRATAGSAMAGTRHQLRRIIA
jgi:hypothetical protein